ncbi:hypothetical protein BJX63DRAFT_321646 [Aspergillus granulosus]|uniref:Uncharacterized protein n=1 Tax=Aspergillus granulosus TaxID=176169 RepID=A0ABR4H4S0_9EURO
MTANSNQTAILNTENDWEDWRGQLEALARTKKIWEIVTGEQAEATEPIDPESSYNSRPPANSTRSSTTPSASEQTHQERQFNWNVYTHRLKEVREQQMAVADTKAWILSTVNRKIRSSNCEPAESIAQWFKNLERSHGMSTYRIKDKVKREYLQAIKTPRVRDIHEWLEIWEKAMQKGLQWKIGRVISCQDWLDDFLNAVSPLHPNWVESYIMTHEEEIEKGTISYRQVSQSFRSRLGIAQPRHKVAKGSFGPTFAEAEVRDESEGDESEKDEPDIAKARKRKRGGTNKVPDRAPTGPRSRRMSPLDNRASTGPGSRRMLSCKACLRKHDWRQCLYLFPDLAVAHFKPNEERTSTL